jgi:hypothetical protein
LRIKETSTHLIKGKEEMIYVSLFPSIYRSNFLKNTLSTIY